MTRKQCNLWSALFIVILLLVLLFVGNAQATQADQQYHNIAKMKAQSSTPASPSYQFEPPVVVELGVAFMIMFCLYMLPTIVCGYAAKSKGRSMIGFMILSLLCTPITGLLAVAAFAKKDPTEISIVEDDRFCDACGRLTVEDGVCTNCKAKKPFKL